MSTFLDTITALSGQQLLALLEMAITCSIILLWFSELIFAQSFSLLMRSLLLCGLTGTLFLPSEYWNYLGAPLELPLVAYVRGMVGDLSVLTLFLLWASFFLREKLLLPLQFKLGLVFIALVFYPLALGLSMFDPYAWGYGSWIFLLAVLLVALIVWWARSYGLVLAIALALAAWAFQWHESSNLWDYLIDPFLCLWALLSLAINYYRPNPIKGFTDEA
ncbi:hypothetical protein [Polynucleobacter sp. IMCC 30228]|uniref:hypothetical protein n=1 Tax=Polynucleobacter sp. IMCC 30228 TaxID=2781011 RepID=UPI001F3AD32D|nr:hypothetical protein [Polynucleobacter sp. IMCC 30228]MCE7527755.1 hypothetical protein [Polynucleobacter sp. IMCC 30228]